MLFSLASSCFLFLDDLGKFGRMAIKLLVLMLSSKLHQRYSNCDPSVIASGIQRQISVFIFLSEWHLIAADVTEVLRQRERHYRYKGYLISKTCHRATNKGNLYQRESSRDQHVFCSETLRRLAFLRG